MDERVVILVDMDCFYCQVEEQLNPALKGKPVAVVQYNAWKGGGIIAVNYTARDQGVTRHMRGDEALEKCPEIELVRVPQVRGKADLTKYRDAGKAVAEVLKLYSTLLERASVDEAYLDITDAVNKRIEAETKRNFGISCLQNTFVVGQETNEFIEQVHTKSNEQNLKLLVGAVIAEELRADVYNKTGYRCSAGIAHNKILAKLVCGLHKPNKQTLLPKEQIGKFFQTIPVTKLKSLGGKFGRVLTETFGIKFVSDLLKFSEKELIQQFDEKMGKWLYNIARGNDNEPVTTRLVAKSIGCCKNFQGKAALLTSESVCHWMREMSEEISERLEKDLAENNRKAKQMTVVYTYLNKNEVISGSKCHPLPSYDVEKIAQNAFRVLQRICQKKDGSFHITYLGLNVSNFEDLKNTRNITCFFEKINKPNSNDKNSCESTTTTNELKLNINSTEMSNGNLEHEFSVPFKECVKNDGNIKLDNVESLLANVKDDDKYYVKTQELKVNKEDILFFDESRIVGTKLDSNKDTYDGFFLNFEEERVDNENTLNQTCELSSISSEDSITSELTPKENVSQTDISLAKSIACPKKNSFFVNYFTKSEQSSSRHFDTSRVLDLENSHDDDFGINEDVQTQTDEDKVKCEECEKYISPAEIVSHKDYHYALKLVQQESKQNCKVAPRVKGREIKKKKVSNIVSKGQASVSSWILGTNSVDNFNEDTQVCDYCSKRVKLSHYAEHIDFHVAKKIYMELNPPKLPKLLASCKKGSIKKR